MFLKHMKENTLNIISISKEMFLLKLQANNKIKVAMWNSEEIGSQARASLFWGNNT